MIQQHAPVQLAGATPVTHRLPLAPAKPQPLPTVPPITQPPPITTPPAQASPAREPLAAHVGIWLIIGGELLLLPCLLCLYAVYRFDSPDVFKWAFSLFDLGWGFIGLAVLLLSSVNMAMAVRCAMSRQRITLLMFLTLTVMCAIVFLGVKTIEYREQFTAAFIEPPAPRMTAPPPIELPVVATSALAPADDNAALLTKGRAVYRASCASCHGPAGEGVNQLGLPLSDSPMVREWSIDALSDFVVEGRLASHPDSRMNAVMPPRGGNPFLADADIRAVSVYLKSLAGVEDSGAVATGGTELAAAGSDDLELLIPRWVVPMPQQASFGLTSEHLQPRLLPAHPSTRAWSFFGIYMALTGVQIVHLLIGIGVLAWLGWRVRQGHFDTGRILPLRLGGLYWHVGTAMWLILFPLLYLLR